MDVIPKIIVQNDTDTVADMNNFKVISSLILALKF